MGLLAVRKLGGMPFPVVDSADELHSGSVFALRRSKTLHVRLSALWLPGRRASERCSPGCEAAPERAQADPSSSWDRSTQRLVAGSTLPFLLLLLPQLWKNHVNLCAGNAAARGALSWLVGAPPPRWTRPPPLACPRKNPALRHHVAGRWLCTPRMRADDRDGRPRCRAT
jgi:hypothetical protein